jgi:hypothetical protein
MKPSEVVKELAKQVHEFVNSREFDGKNIPITSIHLMLVNWFVDHNVNLEIKD